jgi:hypothetical protein
MTLESSRSAVWLAVNVCAVLLYLYISSWTWLQPELRSEPGASGGDAFIWFLSAFPVFLITQVMNLGVVMWAAVQRRRHGSWPFVAWSWIILVVWLTAYRIDVYHR